MKMLKKNIIVRNIEPADFPAIIAMTKELYPDSGGWSVDQLNSHLKWFPEGQFVAVDSKSNSVVGYSASLIILWDDYHIKMSWRDFTENGYFSNHDPINGKTLYGADVMVKPSEQGRGIGKALYKARRELVEHLGLLRIRAGARLQGYHRHKKLTPENYVKQVVSGNLMDPTLSFQLKQGFHVLAVAKDYLRHDPKSLGHAAVIEWINKTAAKPEDYAGAKKAAAHWVCKLGTK